MNSYNVISLNADVALNEHVLVVLTATGVALAAANSAAKSVVGTNIHPVDAGKPSSVALKKAFGLHYVTIVDATNIAIGDELDLAANGQVVKHAAGTVIGVALQPNTDGAGAIIRAYLYPA